MITHHALCIMRLNYMKIIKRVISIDISNKITEIPPYAFNGCDSIKTIYIPDSVKINCNAFENCTNLSAVNIPSNTESIDTSAFKNCLNIKDINIPDSTVQIGNQAFYNCSNLEKFNSWQQYSGFWNRCIHRLSKLGANKL